MIDDRLEELASLYTLNLLERDDRAQFEAELTRHAALRQVVCELQDTSAALVHAAPVVRPPAELKARILASIPGRESSEKMVRPAPGIFRVYLPWAVAAGFALCAAWSTQLYFARHSASALLRDQAALAEVSLQSLQQHREAERILNQRQIADLEGRVAVTHSQLAEVREQFAERERQIVSLTNALKAQADLANLKITALVSLLNNSPKALAVAVWNPNRQEGLLQVEQLPALLPNQDYQLWVVDPQYANPVDGGVFTVDPASGAARLAFKAKQPVSNVSAFAVTLERKGGVPKAEGPFVLLGK